MKDGEREMLPPNSIEVPHTRIEYEVSKLRGGLNWQEAIKTPYYRKSRKQEWETGFIGEDVVAKYFGVYPYTNKYKTDIKNLQVRSITKPHHNLILRDTDRGFKDNIYILVLVDHSSYRHRILGWIYGDDAMTDRYRREIFRHEDPENSDFVWMVSPMQLNDIKALR